MSRITQHCRGYTAVWEEGGVYADIFLDGVRIPVDVLNRNAGDGSKVWKDGRGLRSALGDWVRDYGTQYRQAHGRGEV